MKKILILALLAVAQLGFSQGSVNFQNKVGTAGIDAPVSYAAGSALGGSAGTKIDGTVHPTAQVALYGGPDGATVDQLILIAPMVNFRPGAAAGYVNVGQAGERDIPGVPLGGFAMVQIRAWDTADGTTAATYELAAAKPNAYVGTSALLRIKTGGDTPVGGTPNPPGNLIGLQAFSINIVPEPGTIALGFLGLGGLFLLRRKK